MSSKPPKFPHLNLEQYVSLTRAMATLSGLFSVNEAPLISPRFAEKLFVACLNKGFRLKGSDISRLDNSFDAIINDPMLGRVGVGVKTFLKGDTDHKIEKVAEFTKYAGKNDLKSLSKKDLIEKVSELRNARVESDIADLGITKSNNFYHCLVREKGGFFIHEENYPLVDTSTVHLSKNQGRDPKGNIYFEDNFNHYKYSLAKNVLYKKFEFGGGTESECYSVDIAPNPFEVLFGLISGQASKLLLPKNLGMIITNKKEFVVLPLYSSRTSTPKVPVKSGLNHWNADGRPRKFGEAYFPVAKKLLEKRRGFFPIHRGMVKGKEKDVCDNFKLRLPNGTTVSARLCQQELKALMSNPNEALAPWLFAVIDGSYEKSQQRHNPLDKSLNKPYTYEDLERIEKDCIYVFKEKEGVYSIEFAPFGAYEVFKKLEFKKMLLADFEEHLEKPEEFEV